MMHTDKKIECVVVSRTGRARDDRRTVSPNKLLFRQGYFDTAFGHIVKNKNKLTGCNTGLKRRLEQFHNHWSHVHSNIEEVVVELNQKVLKSVANFVVSCSSGVLDANSSNTKHSPYQKGFNVFSTTHTPQISSLQSTAHLGIVPVVHLDIGVSFGDAEMWLQPLIDTLRSHGVPFVAHVQGSRVRNTKDVFVTLVQAFGVSGNTTVGIGNAEAKIALNLSTSAPTCANSIDLDNDNSSNEHRSSRRTSTSTISTHHCPLQNNNYQTSKGMALRGGKRYRSENKRGDSFEADIALALKKSLLEHQNSPSSQKTLLNGSQNYNSCCRIWEDDSNKKAAENISLKKKRRFSTRSSEFTRTNSHLANQNHQHRDLPWKQALKFGKQYWNNASAMMLANDLRQWYHDNVKGASKVESSITQHVPLVVIFTESEALSTTILHRCVRILMVQMPKVPVTLIMVNNKLLDSHQAITLLYMLIE